MMMVIKILTKTWKGDDDKAWSALSWQAAGSAGSCTSHTHASLYNCNFFNSFLVRVYSFHIIFAKTEFQWHCHIRSPFFMVPIVDDSQDGGDDIYCWYFWN